MINDPEVKACPECETPNQFGELCSKCEVEINRINQCDDEFDRRHSLNDYGE